MAKYSYINYSKIQDFCQDLPDDKKEQLQPLVSEGHQLARMALKASLDATGTAACSIRIAVVMRLSIMTAPLQSPQGSANHC